MPVSGDAWVTLSRAHRCARIPRADKIAKKTCLIVGFAVMPVHPWNPARFARAFVKSSAQPRVGGPTTQPAGCGGSPPTVGRAERGRVSRKPPAFQLYSGFHRRGGWL